MVSDIQNGSPRGHIAFHMTAEHSFYVKRQLDFIKLPKAPFYQDNSTIGLREESKSIDISDGSKTQQEIFREIESG